MFVGASACGECNSELLRVIAAPTNSVPGSCQFPVLGRGALKPIKPLRIRPFGMERCLRALRGVRSTTLWVLLFFFNCRHASSDAPIPFNPFLFSKTSFFFNKPRFPSKRGAFEALPLCYGRSYNLLSLVFSESWEGEGAGRVGRGFGLVLRG